MTQKLRVKVPIGFVMVIQESFQNPTGATIFVFKHKESGRKLYCKLCDIADLKKGLVWEVLDVDELRSLEIQESYNAEMERRADSYVVEESGAGVEPWDPTSDESFEDYKKRMQGQHVAGKITKKQLDDVLATGGSVNIYVGSQGKEGEGKSKEEVLAENEDLKNKISILAARRFQTKKREIGCTDPNVTTPEQLMTWEQTRDPTRKTSSGTLTLEGQSSTGAGLEFDSQLEMIQFLQRRIHSRRSSPEQKREAQQVKDILWKKFLAGKKGKAKNEGFDDIEDEGTPLLTKFYEEWKKREKGDDS